MNGVYLSAETVYNTLCEALDGMDIKYDKNESNLAVSVASKTDDLDLELRFFVDSKRHVVSLFSRIPVTVPEDKKIDLTIATNLVNKKIINGCFDFDITKESVIFRLTNTYVGYKTISSELFDYMLRVSYLTVDEYNDKFFALAKGLMDLEKFIEMMNK